MRIIGVITVVAIAFAGRVPTATAESGSLHHPPIQGLRDCPNGGIVLPGSSTCLRFSGSVRTETTVRTDFRSITHTGGSATLAVDARAPTELGPVRIYTAVRVRDGSH